MCQCVDSCIVPPRHTTAVLRPDVPMTDWRRRFRHRPDQEAARSHPTLQPFGPPACHMDMRDLRLAFRTLVRTPFVTSIAVLSLALGIGANAAIYSTFDRMLLAPLPVREPT